MQQGFKPRLAGSGPYSWLPLSVTLLFSLSLMKYLKRKVVSIGLLSMTLS